MPEPLPPLPLSVAIVCKDSAATIGRTLESVRGLADEIVAIDSGSTDATVPILESHRAKVIRSEWFGHVRTKQMALDQCSRGWVLCLDSDESVLPDLAAAIRGAIAGGESGFEINRRTYYRDRPLLHAWQPEWRLRLVRRGKARWAGHDPHDYMELIDGSRPARVGGGAASLRHDSFSTFAEHLRKQWGHASTMAASLHAAGKRGSYPRLMLSPAGAFLKQLLVKRGFMDGYGGWLAAASTAAGSLMKHAILLELASARPATPGDSKFSG